MNDDKFMFLLPILCFDCGKPLANKQEAINRLLYEEKISFVDAMERLGIMSYCCRQYVVSPLTIPFGLSTKPIGSIGEFEVYPDVIQVWTGTSSLIKAPNDRNAQSILNIDITTQEPNLLPPVSESLPLFIPPSEFQESLLSESIFSSQF